MRILQSEWAVFAPLHLCNICSTLQSYMLMTDSDPLNCGRRVKPFPSLCLFYIFITLLLLALRKVFVYLLWKFSKIGIKQKDIQYLAAVECSVKRAPLLFYTRCKSSELKCNFFIVCLRPLYDFCNEIGVCFPDQWVLLIVLATFLFSFFFPIQGVLYSVCISRAAALTRASACEAKMLISQTVPIGITPRSASGEG